MPFNTNLAARVRKYLSSFPQLDIEEKKMFGGLAFLVNGKMCANVSGENLMCRFDPCLMPKLAEKPGFMPVVMRGKELKGYCYVDPMELEDERDFRFWMELCLSFNQQAKSAKKGRKKE